MRCRSPALTSINDNTLPSNVVRTFSSQETHIFSDIFWCLQQHQYQSPIKYGFTRLRFFQSSPCLNIFLKCRPFLCFVLFPHIGIDTAWAICIHCDAMLPELHSRRLSKASDCPFAYRISENGWCL
jgi:hypothetical protein